ncbi:MAG TPA: DUF3048 domain-containing protein [Clostridiales bacterium]|nr:DUF3048 domain-containing protein [Clostridiales bacterium]
MKKTIYLLSLGLLLSLSLFLTACGKQDEGSQDGATVSDPEFTCPLDGKELSSAEDHGDSVFIVSIDNGAGAAPQSGLNAADLLIEMPVEGGINRFLAFYYHNEPDTIGPVRSARHYFYDIVNGYNATLAHCGGSSMAYDIIDSGSVQDIDEMSCSGNFWRSSERKAPHNLYTSYELLSKKAADRGYDEVSLKDCPAFDFYSNAERNDLVFGGVSELTVPYRYQEASYQWDTLNHNYVRYSDGEMHTDAFNNEALTADNVVVVYIDYVVMADGQHLDMTFTSGSGLLLQYGTVTEIDWSITKGNGFSFTDQATGKEVQLIPGKTIIQVAKTTETATYTQPEAEDATAEGAE